MLRIMRIGIPNAVENGVFQVGKIVVQSIVVSLGTTATAAHAITIQIEIISLHPSLAICTAMLTVVGQALGAGKKEEARCYAVRLSALSQLLCIVLSAFTIVFTPTLCSFTELSAEGIHLVSGLVTFICIGRMLVWSPAFTLPNALRAAGDVKYPLIISVMSM